MQEIGAIGQVGHIELHRAAFGGGLPQQVTLIIVEAYVTPLNRVC